MKRAARNPGFAMPDREAPPALRHSASKDARKRAYGSMRATRSVDAVVLSGDDSNRFNATSEPVVDADPEQARLEAMARAGEPIGPVGQVDIKVLDPRRPGVGERD